VPNHRRRCLCGDSGPEVALCPCAHGYEVRDQTFFCSDRALLDPVSPWQLRVTEPTTSAHTSISCAPSQRGRSQTADCLLPQVPPPGPTGKVADRDSPLAPSPKSGRPASANEDFDPTAITRVCCAPQVATRARAPDQLGDAGKSVVWFGWSSSTVAQGDDRGHPQPLSNAVSGLVCRRSREHGRVELRPQRLHNWSRSSYAPSRQPAESASPASGVPPPPLEQDDLLSRAVG